MMWLCGEPPWGGLSRSGMLPYVLGRVASVCGLEQDGEMGWKLIRTGTVDHPTRVAFGGMAVYLLQITNPASIEENYATGLGVYTKSPVHRLRMSRRRKLTPESS